MLKKTIHKVLLKYGYNIIKIEHKDEYADMGADFRELYEKCRPYTMTTVERMHALYQSIEYLIRNNIKGDLVECGTWRGGSAMLMAYALKKFKAEDRKIYIYDTFEGMSQPTALDVDQTGETASSLLESQKEDKENSVWCLASMQEVQHNMFTTGYRKENIVFVKGKVEETIPGTTPDKISLLRLDTDWYESTSHELRHLYPLLSEHGVLIIDDYGHWQGARRAVDEFFAQNGMSPLLHRIDYTGRISIKISPSGMVV